MAVNTKSVKADKPKDTPKVDGPQEASTFSLNLRSPLKRYMYGDRLYLADEVYSFDEEGARHMLMLLGPGGLPVFALSRGAADNSKIVKANSPLKVEQLMEDEAHALVPTKVESIPTPTSVTKIDLSDDDPDILAKLQAADADAGSPVAL